MSGDERAAQVVEVATAELDGLRALAEERAALLRVAELVAQDGSPAEVFATVVTEASRLLRGQAMTLSRFEGAGELVVVASCYGPAPVGDRVVFEAGTLPDRVLRRAAVVRVDDYAGERDAALARSYGLGRRCPRRSPCRTRCGGC
jgi:hypothetical protein